MVTSPLVAIFANRAVNHLFMLINMLGEFNKLHLRALSGYKIDVNAVL